MIGRLFWWYVLMIRKYGMKAKPKEYQLLVSKKKTSTINSNNIKIDTCGVKIASSLEKTLLDIFIDNQLIFKSHICSMLKKASLKLNALTWVASYMYQKKGEWLWKLTVICNSVIALWYGWCIVGQWIKKINGIHERALRIVHQNAISTFEEILNKDNFVKIHTRYLQFLGTGMFKVKTE